MKQTFFVDGFYLGVTQRTQFLRHAEMMKPHSIGFCCPYCGTLWARAMLTDNAEKTAQWSFVHASCKRCPSYMGQDRPPGSIYLDYDHNYCDELPFEVMEREFTLSFDNLMEQLK